MIIKPILTALALMSLLAIPIATVATDSTADKDRPAKERVHDAPPGDRPPADDDDATASTKPASENAPAIKDAATSTPFAQSKFVPDISFILDVSYLQRDRDNEVYRTLFRPGYAASPADEAEHGHKTRDPQPRGFSFNYGELALYSVVDPYFDLFAVIELVPTGASIEEAYFTTTSLPFGFQMKSGKFLSSFGRLNEQHAHYWDFYGSPLVYDAFFGGDLNEIGARLSWVAPLDFYLMIGAEALHGENASSFGAAGFSDAAETMRVRDSDDPNLGVGYVKTSFDVGDLTVFTGASGAYGRSRINHGLDRSGVPGYGFFGHTHVVGADLTAKYQFDSKRYLTLQAEYLYRFMEGTRYDKDDLDEIVASDMTQRQSGLYAQLVGKFAMRWRAGVRYDLLAVNDMKLEGVRTSLPESTPRYACMVDFNPTEFSRFRLQYNYDESMHLRTADAYTRRPNHEVILQVNITIGAHGAHSF